MALDSSLARFAMLGMFAGLDSGPSGVTTVVVAEDPTDLITFVGESGVALSVDVSAETGDLTQYGDLEWVIERLPPSRADVQVVAMADITIGGTGNRRATFTPSAAVLLTPKNYGHALRQVSTGYVIAQGLLKVKYAASVDPA